MSMDYLGHAESTDIILPGSNEPPVCHLEICFILFFTLWQIGTKFATPHGQHVLKVPKKKKKKTWRQRHLVWLFAKNRITWKKIILSMTSLIYAHFNNIVFVIFQHFAHTPCGSIWKTVFFTTPTNYNMPTLNVMHIAVFLKSSLCCLMCLLYLL